MKYKIKFKPDGTPVRKLTLKDEEVIMVMGVIGVSRLDKLREDGLDVDRFQALMDRVFSKWADAERETFPKATVYNHYRKQE